jgi:FAD/FMN-containing dehydrogenase
VVFPKSIDETIELVRWAGANRVGLVPSGGRTGLSGGACALSGEVVVSFEKMNRILEFDLVDRTVRVEPGVITEQLQEYAKAKGFFYPVDFAARGSSQIGGNIATNAGGVKVLRYGSTREWVAGLKVVTGTGALLDLNKGLVKNATGFDLRHLMVGSEGTLGLVVEAEMRLTQAPHPLRVLVLGVRDLDAIMRVYQEFRNRLPITAFEYFSDLALQTVIDHAHLAAPLASRHPHYVLIEVEQTDSSIEEQTLNLFETCLENDWAQDGTMSQSETQARELWRLREDISEATAPFTPYKNDISVTISKVPEFLAKTDAILSKHYPDFRVVWFGHIGDGNMHINVLKPGGLGKDEFLKRCQHVNQLLFDVIEQLQGSVSAEHGVGLVKKSFLSRTRSTEEIELMRMIKRSFDPLGILNPGKIFD